jgi:hypothetical protein
VVIGDDNVANSTTEYTGEDHHEALDRPLTGRTGSSKRSSRQQYYTSGASTPNGS